MTTYLSPSLIPSHTCSHAHTHAHPHTHIKDDLGSLAFKIIHKLRDPCRKMCSLVIHFSRTYFLSFIIWDKSFSRVRFVPIYILHPPSFSMSLFTCNHPLTSWLCRLGSGNFTELCNQYDVMGYIFLKFVSCPYS